MTLRYPTKGVIEFSDYDAFRNYEHDHPELSPLPEHPSKWPWPVLHVTFSTARILLDDEDPDFSRLGELSFCSGTRIGTGDILWQSRVVTHSIAGRIKAAAAAGPQTYEIFVSYTHASVHPDRTAATLLPPPDDLCLSILTWKNWPAGPTTGTSLLISRDSVASALGILPRRISPTSETAY